jgi:death-on-curing family protein
MFGAGYVEFIHDEMIAQLWPGSDPVRADDRRDRGMIESAAGRPFHSAFGQDAYPTVVQKAAALFHSLIANHPFHDGNKRTAVLAFGIFLVANGHYCMLGNTPMYQLAEQIASYRERGRSHAQALQDILNAVAGQVVSLSELRNEHYVLYRANMQMRSSVRRNRLNKLIAAD